ncbi:MAG: RnfH family protein [Proteobacteria bacterium]|nr:MAG: RnfH family protein [Pseudomonadota bacterium]
MLKIEVTFATPQLQKTIAIEVDENTTIIDAIAQSGIQQFFPEYELLNLAVGVFGKRIYDPQSYQIKAGDRIEIYRPLVQTPNQKRLERAKTR